MVYIIAYIVDPYETGFPYRGSPCFRLSLRAVTTSLIERIPGPQRSIYRHARLCAAVLLMTAATAIAAAPAAVADPSHHGGRPQCRPQLIDLGTLTGLGSSAVIATNDRGIWVGDSDGADGYDHAVAWVGRHIVDLDVPQGSWAADISRSGAIVINGLTDAPASVPSRAYVWWHGAAHQLALPSGADAGWSSYVRRVNDTDTAAGSITDDAGVERAAIWPHLGQPVLLPTPSGWTGAYLQGMNDRGDAVGGVYTDEQQVAWEWPAHGGTGHPLAQIDLTGFSQANVVDDAGNVAGISDDGGQPGSFAAIWRGGSLRYAARYASGGYYATIYGGDGRGAYVGNGDYYHGDPNEHVFLTFGGSGPLQSLPPLSGNATDDSNAHAVSTDLTVGGASQITDSTDEHATLWTCAPRQTFVPHLAAPSLRSASFFGAPAFASESARRLVSDSRARN
jgi:hypothetical protein